MITKILLLSFLSFVLNADIISYYQKALDTLQYNKTYSLYKQSTQLSQDGLSYSRYANFSVDAYYSSTQAKILNNPFSTADISIRDTFDIFGKKTYQIQLLALNIKAQKYILNIQKSKLFGFIVKIVSLYHTQESLLTLHKNLYSKQKKIYDKLNILQNNGVISTIDLLRFKNSLTLLKTRIIKEHNDVIKMKKQLELYVPKERVPLLESKFIYSKNDFLSKNQMLRLSEINSDKLLLQAKSSQNAYLPELSTSLAYQKINDPTSYGDNYSLSIGVHIPLNSAKPKEAQALRIKALKQNNKNMEYKIQKMDEYIQRYQDYKSSSEQLKFLNENLLDYEKSEKILRAAFIKQYVNFNNYIQVLTQTLNIKEKILLLQAQRSREATILNATASGAIYE